MIRIDAPHFCAGTGAPILSYMRGWSEERILNYCRAKGWKVERMSEYQKFDSDSELKVWAPRLAKDAEVVTTKNGEMTKLTFVHSSSNEDDEEMWMEAIVNDGQAEKAAGLLKGDAPAGIDGFLTSKRSNQDPTKVFYTLKRARIHFGVALLAELKERGGKPKAKGGKPAAKGAKPAAKPAKPAAKKPARPIIEDDEDETDDGEE